MHPNLDDEHLGMDEPPVEYSPVESSHDKTPYNNLPFHFDTNPDVDFCHDTDTNYYVFCLGANAYLDTSLDDLKLGNIFKNLGIDPGIGIGITAPFKLKPSNERGAGGIDSGIDENPDTALYDDLGINTTFDFTINHCADTGLENKYS